MADSKIKDKPNLTTLASASGLDIMLLEALTSGSNTSDPSQNTYTTKNIFIKDLMTTLGLSKANKIINGDMRIDQRNAGASVTFSNSLDTFNLDRWRNQTNAAGTRLIATQASAGGLAGLNYCNGFVSQSAYSVTAGEYFVTSQFIEGLNCQDLLWGTASAKAVTLSFWVYSSLTGLHGGSINNSGQDRSYPYSYTINAANTWEYKTITIPGDTTGTWLTTNGVGVRVRFSLGMGSTYKGTAGAWSGSTYFSCTGEVSTVGTNAATWYVTGVKLEVGSIATPFVPDDYTTSLAKCQRYYDKSYNIDIVPGANSGAGTFYIDAATDSNIFILATIFFKVKMRTNPTLTGYRNTGTSGSWDYGQAAGAGIGAVTFTSIGCGSAAVYITGSTAWAAAYMYGQWVADAEL